MFPVDLSEGGADASAVDNAEQKEDYQRESSEEPYGVDFQVGACALVQEHEDGEEGVEKYEPA